MERLTNKREADAQRKEYENRIRNGYPRNIPEERFLRLAAYEDTDLMPEEIAAADRLGRVVVLPCKAGDTLYEVTSRKTISEYRVKAIRVELFCVFIEWDIANGFVDKSVWGVTANEIGKTVFLTREEAEKALKGEENERG